MPELPEVEAARKAISERCAGKRIVRAVVADDPKVIDSVSPSDFEAALVGKTLVTAHRKGKNLWLQLDSPPFPSFQFGMAGAVYIKGVAVTQYKRSAVNDDDEWPSKYSKLLIELDDGLEMSFTDKRRFAKVRLLKDPATVPPISELGPDALLKPMAADEFHEAASKKKIVIKALLLDQSFISGIGNWIADEVLYHARIHPLQLASSLSRESCENLTNCIKEVIERAVEVGADSSRYPSNWVFHYREKKPGKVFVDGKKIGFITAAGRTTAYVPELQKLEGKEAAKAVDGKQKTKNLKAKGGQGEEQDEDVEESNPVDGKQKTKNLKAKGGQGEEQDEDVEESKPVDGKQKTRNLKAKGGQGEEQDEDVEESNPVDGKQKTRNLKAKEGQGEEQDEDAEESNTVDGKQKTRNLKAKGGHGEEQDKDVEKRSKPVDPLSKEEEIAYLPNKKRELKPRGRGKRPAAKRKAKTDEEDTNNNDGDEVDDGEDDNRDKSGRRVTDRKVRPKTATEKVTSQIAGKLKKTVK